jgi:hypothetical protein
MGPSELIVESTELKPELRPAYVRSNTRDKQKLLQCFPRCQTPPAVHGRSCTGTCVTATFNYTGNANDLVVFGDIVEANEELVCLEGEHVSGAKMQTLISYIPARAEILVVESVLLCSLGLA